MNEIHFFKNSEGYEVWLDTEVDTHDGICIGVGKTKAEAIDSAIVDIQNALNVLSVNRAREVLAENPADLDSANEDKV